MTASIPEQVLNHTPDKSWLASLSLRFSQRGTPAAKKSALVSALHKGPLRVQRAFYPEGPSVPHIYLLHPPGGVVAGDELSINIQVDENAHGLVTTPSAGRVYRTNHQGLLQQQTLQASVAAGGVLEWLPQENIIFTGANGINTSRFHLSAGAHLMAWDICALGRVAGDQPFEKGRFTQVLEVYEDNAPALIERFSVDGDSELLNKSWGLQGFTVFGTFVSNVTNEDLLKALKNKLQQSNQDYVLAFTQKKSFLICRYMGHSAIQGRTMFSQAWSLIRPYSVDRAACEPRIWHT